MITGYYMTKEFVQSNMSNLLEDIRRNCISINLGVVDTMWVCDVMNNEKMGSLISFAYESPQCDTPVDALYDAYTWLIKNGKIEIEKKGESLNESVYNTEDKEIYQAISVGLTDVFNEFGWSDFGGVPIEKIQDWLDAQ